MTLLTPSLPFLSREAKAATQNLDKFKEIASSSSKKAKDNLHLDRMFGIFTKNPERETKPILGQEKDMGINLPRLAGILRATTLEDGMQYRAIIEGRSLGKNDSVNGFTVKKITPGGVTLTRVGNKWFIPAPQVDFSLDKGL